MVVLMPMSQDISVLDSRDLIMVANPIGTNSNIIFNIIKGVVRK